MTSLPNYFAIGMLALLILVFLSGVLGNFYDDLEIGQDADEATIKKVCVFLGVTLTLDIA